MVNDISHAFFTGKFTFSPQQSIVCLSLVIQMPIFQIFSLVLLVASLTTQLPDFQEIAFKDTGLRARCGEFNFNFGF